MSITKNSAMCACGCRLGIVYPASFLILLHLQATGSLELGTSMTSAVWDGDGLLESVSEARAGPGKTKAQTSKTGGVGGEGTETVGSRSRTWKILRESEGSGTFVITRRGARKQEGATRTPGWCPSRKQLGITPDHKEHTQPLSN